MLLVAARWRCTSGRLAHDWFYSHRWADGDTGKNGSKFVVVPDQKKQARRQMQLEKKFVSAVQAIVDKKMKEKPNACTYHGFYDQECLPPAEDFQVGFVEALEHSKVVVLMLSQTSMDIIKSKTNSNREDNCLFEIEATLQLRSSANSESKMFPLRLSTIKSEEVLYKRDEKGEYEKNENGDKIFDKYCPSLKKEQFADIQDVEERTKKIQAEAEADEKCQEWASPGYFAGGEKYVNRPHHGGLGWNVRDTMSQVGRLLWNDADVLHLGNYKKVAEALVQKVDEVNLALARSGKRGR
jgi:hypothetical protein